jgi:hypothetical protein
MNPIHSFVVQHWALLVMLGSLLMSCPFVFGNINTVKQGDGMDNRWYPCPSAVTSGMPVLIGTLAAVALDAYDSSTGGTTFQLDGSYSLTVIGQSQLSPNSPQAITVGEELFANGTLDATTGVTYNLTIDVTRGNTPFGNLDQNVGINAGVTNTSAIVRLKKGGSGPYAS